MRGAPGVDLVRIATMGSVDDGKSTLLGRLLLDTGSLPDDEIEHVERLRRERRWETADLSLVTDGLRAEREQGITIDVAHRTFSTARRRFLLADTPGHVEYTRNTVTGASTADVALVTVDAVKGMTRQTRRHTVLAAMLAVPHVVLVVNKMDAVGFEEAVLEAIRAEFDDLAAGLGLADVVVVPVSALHGDNVVVRSDRMPWYAGEALLPHLEHLPVAVGAELADLRLPIQTVLEAADGSRGLAGTVASGVLRPGDRVAVLPAGTAARVAAIDGPGGPLAEAHPPMAVVVRLDGEVDAGRGDLLCRPRSAPRTTRELDATVCWFEPDRDLTAGDVLDVKHTTRWTRAEVVEVAHRIDVDTLRRERSDVLAANDVGRVRLRTVDPLLVDPYSANRATGSFILVDGTTHRTVGAGMLAGGRHA